MAVKYKEIAEHRINILKAMTGLDLRLFISYNLYYLKTDGTIKRTFGIPDDGISPSVFCGMLGVAIDSMNTHKNLSDDENSEMMEIISDLAEFDTIMKFNMLDIFDEGGSIATEEMQDFYNERYDHYEEVIYRIGRLKHE